MRIKINWTAVLILNITIEFFFIGYPILKDYGLYGYIRSFVWPLGPKDYAFGHLLHTINICLLLAALSKTVKSHGGRFKWKPVLLLICGAVFLGTSKDLSVIAGVILIVMFIRSFRGKSISNQHFQDGKDGNSSQNIHGDQKRFYVFQNPFQRK